MRNMTFIQYLIELEVSDDPTQALKDVKQAARNPSGYRKQQTVTNVDNEKEIQQNKNDPLKSEKLRISKMRQQLLNNEKRLAQKEKSDAQRAGIEPNNQGQM